LILEGSQPPASEDSGSAWDAPPPDEEASEDTENSENEEKSEVEESSSSDSNSRADEYDRLRGRGAYRFR